MMKFGDAVASAGPYANNLYLAQDRQPVLFTPTSHYSIFFFLTPNQQCQSTEGTISSNMTKQFTDEKQVESLVLCTI